MFTPPPSPLPPMRQAPERDTHTVRTRYPPLQYTQLSRKTTSRSVRWTVMLVPLVLVLLAAYTHFWVHPAFFDLLSIDGDHERTNLMDWSFHQPHKITNNRLVKGSILNGLVARDTSIPTPTVPVDPALPTPFPQPFDTTLSANFSTDSCFNFFLNMTQTDAFRECRPLSLLISTSHAFENAQNDINLMNTDVWGTCNTDIPQLQCNANMAWFASSLQSSCQTDLANEVETAVAALNALHTYDLMRNAACQVNPMTNSYCFVEAVASSDPSSYWFYQLPVGLPLGPKVMTSACNQCTSGLMALYASALENATETGLEGLARTYNTAANMLNNICGSSYAKNAQVANPSLACMSAGVPSTGWLVVLGVLVASVLCGS